MSDFTLEVTHKGEWIYYDSADDNWHWRSGEYQNVSLKRVKEAINRFKRQQFKEVYAWYRPRYSQAEHVKVKVISRGATGSEFLIQTETGRNRVYLSQLFADTPENATVIERYAAKLKELEAKQAELEQLEAEFVLLDEWLLLHPPLLSHGKEEANAAPEETV